MTTGVVDFAAPLPILEPVDPERPDPDVLLERTVADELAAQPSLANASLNVSVNRAVATLVGNVDTSAGKSRAVAVARTTRGVRAVVDLIAVPDVEPRPPPQDEGALPPRPDVPPPSDAELTSAVRDALAADPRVPPRVVRILVARGVVTLSGTVSGPDVRDAADSDARNADGTRRVTNLVKVRPLPTLSDKEIGSAVERALRADPLLRREPILVAVRSGEVMLSGNVATLLSRAWATRVAAYVPGVVAVDNTLTPRRVLPPAEAVFPPGP